MRKLVLVIFTVIFVSVIGIAQELRCNVTVSSTQIKGANQNLFRTMQADLYEFMNNRK